jgi:predicted peroxiredoxin
MTQNARKYLFTVSTFDADPDRVATPLVLANSALAGGGDVLLWLTVDGAELGKRGAADQLIPKSFPPVAELFRSFTENGGQIGVCPPCGKTHGVTDDNMVKNGQWMGAAAVLAAAQDRQTFSF